MRIVIAAGIFPPDIGGPATYAEVLAGYLVKLGHSVTVICHGESMNADLAGKYRIIRISRNQPTWLIYIKYIYRLLKLSAHSDLIYAQGPISGGIQAYVASRILSKPYILKITGDYAWEQSQLNYKTTVSVDDFQNYRGALPKKIKLMRLLQHVAAKSADAVIVPSNYLKSMALGWGSESRKIHVIYNAMPQVGPNRESRDKLRQKLGIQAPLVVTSGRLVPWKGFMTLVDLWPLVAEKIRNAQLLIVGSGPDEQRLKNYIQKLKLQSQVLLTGSRSREELYSIYQAADVFVLNSSYEGLSHTILEAIASSVPCVVSDCGGNPEIIDHRESGLLFRVNNRDEIASYIIELLQNKNTGETYAKNALKKIAIYNQDAMLDKTVRLLEHCVEHKAL